MATPPNPLIERRNSAAETVDRKRKTASETSVSVLEGLNALFDRLALLAAGALTFSVTLLGHPARPREHRYFIIYAAWSFLLVSLTCCLLRIFASHSHRFFQIVSSRASSEVELIDADSAVVKSLHPFLKYSDSVEPFDAARELKISYGNRERWQTETARTSKWEKVMWKMNVVTQWTAAISLFFGFLFLMGFAVYNTYNP